MAGNLVSAATVIQKLSMVGYSLTWSGVTPVGTVSVQCSNDYSLFPNGKINNPGSWSTLTVLYGGAQVTVVPVTGNTCNGFIDIDSLSAYAVRLIYTAGSGTGTLQVIVNGKVS